MARVAVVGGHGKTGRAVRAALPDAATLGRAEWPDLAEAMEGCDAVYVCTWTSEHPRLVSAAVRAS